MKISELRDASDSAAEAAASSLRRVSDASLSHVSMPDVSMPDALDVDVDDLTDLANSAIEFAGDVAGTVVTQSSRGIEQAIRAARQNPKAAIGIAAVVLLVIGIIAAKRRSSEPSFDGVG